MIDICLIGNRIRELRLQKGLTQSEFAEILSVSFQAVSNWERGIAPPELENLIKIASYFGVLIDDLLSPKDDSLYLGIDGGGTKTEFCVVSASGYVVKTLVKSGCNPNNVGFSKTESIIIEGINELLLKNPSIKAAHLGIAGISTGNYLDRLQNELKKHFPKLKLSIKNDSSNLFAFDDNIDMTVISGTGSVVFVNSGKDYVRLGGWGYLFDNAGSAYDIGRDAVRQALFEEDNKLLPSLMSKKLYEKMGTPSAWDNIKTLYSESKPYIASLATVVFDAYTNGDGNAIKIIDSNAKALAELLNLGIKLYGIAPNAIASGGVFEHYGNIMLPHISKYSEVELILCDLPPIYGACRKALSLDTQIQNEFYDNFKKSYGGKKI